jgi:hypothetical protein
VLHLTTHLGDEVEASRDDDEVFVGGSLACVRERRGSVRMFEGDAAVSTHRIGDHARRHCAGRPRRAPVDLGGEAQRLERATMSSTSPGQHSDHASPPAITWKAPSSVATSALISGGVVRAVDDDHRACARSTPFAPACARWRASISRRPRRVPRPRNASAQTMARGGVDALVDPRAGDQHLAHSARRACAPSISRPPTRQIVAFHARISRPAATGGHPRAWALARAISTHDRVRRGHPATLRAEDAHLVRGDGLRGRAQDGGVVEADVGEDRHVAETRWCSPTVPPRPTSITPTSTPRRRTSRAATVSSSKRVGSLSTAPAGQATEDLDQALVVDGLAVHGNPLVDPTCRLGLV